MKYPIYYLDDLGCVTTPEEWCEATGWPEEEWMAVKMSEAIGVLEFYGLRHDDLALLIHNVHEAGLDAGFTAAKGVCEDYVESRVDKAERRKQLRCSFCPPNRKENAKRKARSDKHKERRHA